MNYAEKESLADLMMIDVADNLGNVNHIENPFISEYVVDLLDKISEMKFATYETTLTEWAIKVLENAFQLSSMDTVNKVWERCIERTFQIVKYYRYE